MLMGPGDIYWGWSRGGIGGIKWGLGQGLNISLDFFFLAAVAGTGPPVSSSSSGVSG